MRMPLISVIVPVYNVENYLGECLDSILGQTMRDIEVLCINDGSTDRSPEILAEYAEKDPRVIVIHQCNAGPGAARNAGIENAAGEYILFVDGDDRLDTELCAKVFAAAERDRAELTFFYHDRMGEDKRAVAERVLRNPAVFDVENLSFIDVTTFVKIYAAVWSRLWKTDYVRRHRLAFPVGLTPEDFPFTWNSLLYSPMVSLVPEPLYHYRETPGSLIIDRSGGYGKEIPEVCEYIRSVMKSGGFYQRRWKEVFLHEKLYWMFMTYEQFPPQLRKSLMSSIRIAFGDDERAFLKTSSSLRRLARDFYAALDGNPFAKFRMVARTTLRRMERKLRKSRPVRAAKRFFRRLTAASGQ